jgi:hypothetical protein
MFSPIMMAFGVALASPNAQPSDKLESEFRNPPASAKPHTWWHWMAGNATKEGITADLEAMAAAGVGGAHAFDAGQGIPPGPVEYNSPQWRDLMAHAMAEAQRLGLEMAMHNCSGWSSSGAPWVKPEHAMKRVVWSEATLEHKGGPAKVHLPMPNIVIMGADIAVWAFPYVAPKERPRGQLESLVGLSGGPGPTPEIDWPMIDPTCAVRIDAPVGKDGGVKVDLPAGKWTILRLGYSLTGARNVASRPGGEGLEVDKLSAKALDAFIAGGLEPLFAKASRNVGRSFSTVLIDSYETGFQNWTDDMVDEFKRLRGYDPSPYLPALAGYAVGDADSTLKFLFDYRQTIAELWAKNYSGHFAERLQRYGMQLALEPYGNGSFDPYTYAKPSGLIMGEYWVGEGSINASVKHSSSVAHVYARKVVGAEALTAGPEQAGWRNQPRQWKPFADRGYALGINRIIYHRFAHQPWAAGPLPGMTMGPWGSHFDRTNTIWPYIPAWNKYLARCQHMLQLGVFVGDVCMFTGDSMPQQYAAEGYQLPEVPKGYDFDFCGPDPLLGLSVQQGLIKVPGGGTYRLLALPETDKMTLATLRKVRDLVRYGAAVSGPKPSGSPSLAEAGQAKEFREIVDQLWGKGRSGMNTYGKGRVFWGLGLGEVLKRIEVPIDFAAEGPGVMAIHRRNAQAEWYFVTSQRAYPRTVTCQFRVKGKTPEIWDPVTGKSAVAGVWRATDAGVSVQVPLEAHGSAFVVFRKQATNAPRLVGVATPDAAGRPRKALKIIKAEYGAGDKMVDVTRQVAALADAGELRMTASNSDLGGDPVVNVVKTFRLTYELGGVKKTIEVRENDPVEIGESTGTLAPPSYEVVAGAKSQTLHLWRSGGYKLKWSTGRNQTVTASLPEPLEVPGGWEVRFEPGWDAPERTTFPKLTSWTEHSLEAVTYFSGTATYAIDLNVPKDYLAKGLRLVLDLGDVRECCRVRLNGKPVAEFWGPPFRVDLTGLAKAGANKLEVDVTNLWTNRLIGDEQYPDDMGWTPYWSGDQLKGWPEWFVKGEPRPEPRRKTFTTWRHVKKDTPLLPSGLLGPVVLRPVRVVEVK